MCIRDRLLLGFRINGIWGCDCMRNSWGTWQVSCNYGGGDTGRGGTIGRGEKVSNAKDGKDEIVELHWKTKNEDDEFCVGGLSLTVVANDDLLQPGPPCCILCCLEV